MSYTANTVLNSIIDNNLLAGIIPHRKYIFLSEVKSGIHMKISGLYKILPERIVADI